MLKAAKIESNLSKFPDSSTQSIDQVNLLVEFVKEKKNQTKMTIVAITVKISTINWCLKEWFWITFTTTHQTIKNQFKYESWVNLKILL